MAYEMPFHKLVLGGVLYTETWNTSLNIWTADQSPVTDALLASVAAVVGSWFPTTAPNGPQFNSNVKLEYVKLNRIGTNGQYFDPAAKTHVYPTPIAGGGTATMVAPQLAGVVSLRTAFERGLASKGRMYLPPSQGYVNPSGTDGRTSTTDALRLANSIATLINSINSAYQTWSGSDFGGSVAVISDKGAGAHHLVTQTRAGRVVDTMRSRRSSLDEDYQTATVAIVP